MSATHTIPVIVGGATDSVASAQAAAALHAAAAAAPVPAHPGAAAPVRPVYDPHLNGNPLQGPNSALSTFANQMLRTLPNLEAVVAALPDDRMDAGAKAAAVAQFGDFTRVATVIRHEAYQADLRVQQESVTPIVSSVQLDGAVPNMPDLRTYKIPEFSGLEGDKTNCINWLSRLLRLARAENLTQESVKDLLERHSAGPASNMITEAIRLDTPLVTLIRSLEVRFASLSHPAQARETCNGLKRGPGETIGTLADRIKRHAFMACRLDKTNRTENENALARDNFLRCLMPAVRSAIQTTISTRALAGLPDMTLTDLIAEGEKIEVNQRVFERNGATASVAFHVAEDETPAVRDGIPREDILEAINYVRDARARQKEAVQRRDYDDRRDNSANSRNQAFRPRPSTPYGRDQSRSPGRNRPRSNSGTRRSLDLSALNVTPDQCAKCGLRGHRFSSQECPLYLVNMMQRPCTACKTGGHLPLCCPAKSSKN